MNPRAPALFIGHGSPMNAVAVNAYTESLRALSARFVKPAAILVISAHWMTKGTFVTHMKNPRTIHDFSGFPSELYAVNYPAPGDPRLADLVRELVADPLIVADDDTWGLDHGTWSVLRHLYPAATIPTVQLSLDLSKPFSWHLELGKKLRPLREKGVMILGSGNVVHNLKRIRWEEDAPAYPWAEEFELWCKEKLAARDLNALTDNALSSESGRLSIPTPDHYVPLLYALGASDELDKLHIEFEGIQNGSISMLSFSYR